jgi:hypothetical protein
MNATRKPAMGGAGASPKLGHPSLVANCKNAPADAALGRTCMQGLQPAASWRTSGRTRLQRHHHTSQSITGTHCTQSKAESFKTPVAQATVCRCMPHPHNQQHDAPHSGTKAMFLQILYISLCTPGSPHATTNADSSWRACVAVPLS